MKKRMIALVCTLALVLGVCAVVATDVTAATDTYQVGFSRVDINPYTPHKLIKGESAVGNDTVTVVSYEKDTDGNGMYIYDDNLGLYVYTAEMLYVYGDSKYSRVTNDTKYSDDTTYYVYNSTTEAYEVKEVTGLPTYYDRVETETTGAYAYKWYDSNGKLQHGDIMQLPLRGNGDTIHRQSTTALIDDNGDGEVTVYAENGKDYGDGLFATCLAVTGTNDETVLLMSVAIIGGFEKMVEDTRAGIVEALKAEGIDIAPENIQIQGTHTHNSIDLSQYKSAYNGKNSATEYTLTGQDGKTYTASAAASNPQLDADAKIVGQEVYDNFSVWYPYLIDQLVAAGVEAVEDRSAATMYKGEIDAGEASGKVMNTVRHYTRVTDDNKEVYVHGSNFNGSNISKNKKGDGTATVNTDGSAELAEANDTMYTLGFQFADGREPIALVNWRAHTTQNDRNGTRLNVSSCYVNRMSQELANAGYRSIFIQGAAGNINPTSSLYGGWCGSSTHTYAYTENDDGSITITKDANGNNTTLSGNIYGEELGKVAVKCMENTVTAQNQVSTGDIKVTNLTFNSDAKSYDEDIMYHAAKTVKDYGASSVDYPFIYPLDVTETIYDALSTEEKGWYNSYSGSSSYKALTASSYTGQTYALASRFHANDVNDNYKETGTQDVALTAFMLGEDVAFVTAPGEMYDRYNSNVSWDDLKNKTQKGIYDALSAVNEWDKLLSTNVGGSYGTPFVMGYANRHIGYLPNKIAYEYCTGSSVAAVGAYEAHCTELNQGEGEHIMDIYASMLGSLATDEDNDLYHSAYCEACKKTVEWKCISTEVNSMAEMVSGGHYFLGSDMTTAQFIPAAGTYCFDLYGNTVTGATRFLYMDNGVGATVNIQDSVGSGVARGCGSTSIDASWGGGVLFVGGDNTLNIYGGTFEQITKDHYVKNGGVLYTRGTVNMYGGTLKGGQAWACGGTVGVVKDSRGTGKFNVYGGTVEQGSEMSRYYTDGTAYNSVFEGGTCVYSSSQVTLSGNANVAEIYMNDAGMEGFTVSGTYTGTANLSYSAALTEGSTIGAADNADISGANISVVGYDDYEVVVEGSALKLAEKSNTVAVIQNTAATEDTEATYTEYTSIQNAIDEFQSTDVALQLQKNITDDITFSENIVLDLNGCNITGAITAEEGVILTCLDSQTADYTVEDGKFGKLSGVTAVAAEGYVKYDHGDGNVSFHKIDTELESINLRSAQSGIYYGATFKGDRYAAEMVQSFGVALSITGAPMDADGPADHSLYSKFEQSDFEPGNESEYTSTILINILNSDNGAITNRRNGTTPIYGCSYIQLTDGTYITGNTVDRTLQWVVEWVNDNWDSLKEEKQAEVIELYKQFPAVLGIWDVDNIKAAAEAQ